MTKLKLNQDFLTPRSEYLRKETKGRSGGIKAPQLRSVWDRGIFTGNPTY